MPSENLLFLMSDQHARRMLGCYGHPTVNTPNLDRLAEHGTRFTNAITPCPICVPARAALATGRYIHQTGHWDNAAPYCGEISSWHHRIRHTGCIVDHIGKLHFRSEKDDNGFSREINPMHIADGVGDMRSVIRDNPPQRNKRYGIETAGSGDSIYQHYDIANATQAEAWLRQPPCNDRPWCLCVSFVCPHPPYTAPPTLFERYASQACNPPPQWRKSDWPMHPALTDFRHTFCLDEELTLLQISRLSAAYFGLCTFLDQQIGRVLQALDDSGLAEYTRVIYTSDHGESLGARGMVGKFTMYEESVGVPLILAGPDVPKGRVCTTPATLVDIYPTMLEAMNVTAESDDLDQPGQSLLQLAVKPDCDRNVFSEYHGVGSRQAAFMVRNQRYKYIYHVGHSAQLFDLRNDPDELMDLIDASDYCNIVKQMESELKTLLVPENIDAQAKANQQARISSHGGVAAVRRLRTFTNSPIPNFHKLGLD